MKQFINLGVAVAIAAIAVPAFTKGNTGFQYIQTRDAVVFGGSQYAFRVDNRDDLHNLFIQRMDADTRINLYQSDGVLTDIKVSAEGSIVGVLEKIWIEGVGEDEGTFVDRRADELGNITEIYSTEMSTLVLIDDAGSVVDRVANVRKYNWSPNSQQIAFITGMYKEDGHTGFDTGGTWIYNLATGEIVPIYEQGIDVEWVDWDGNIYILDEPQVDGSTGQRVLKYNPENSELSATSHQGINFSPDGSLYFVQGDTIKPLSVYRTSDNDTPLFESFPFQISSKVLLAVNARGWVDDSTIIIPSPIPGESGDYLINLADGTRLYAPGPVLTTSTGEREILMQDGLSFMNLKVTDLETNSP